MRTIKNFATGKLAIKTKDDWELEDETEKEKGQTKKEKGQTYAKKENRQK